MVADGPVPPAGWVRLPEWCRRQGVHPAAAYTALRRGFIRVGRDAVKARVPGTHRLGWYVRPDLTWPSRQRAGLRPAAARAEPLARGPSPAPPWGTPAPAPPWETAGGAAPERTPAPAPPWETAGGAPPEGTPAPGPPRETPAQPGRAADPAHRWGPTGQAGFTRWLLEQAHRTDPVGRLARFAAADPCWPQRVRTLRTVEQHLAQAHGDSPWLVGAVRAAWREWRAVRG